MPTSDDRPIEEIREIRRRISEQCGHDPARLVEYYMKVQEQYKDRLLADRPAEPARGQDAA